MCYVGHCWELSTREGKEVRQKQASHVTLILLFLPFWEGGNHTGALEACPVQAVKNDNEALGEDRPSELDVHIPGHTMKQTNKLSLVANREHFTTPMTRQSAVRLGTGANSVPVQTRRRRPFQAAHEKLEKVITLSLCDTDTKTRLLYKER